MKSVTFANGTVLEYIEALHIKRDFEGANREGLQFTLPCGPIGFDALLDLVDEPDNLRRLKLHNVEAAPQVDEQGVPVLDDEGNPVMQEVEFHSTHDHYQLVQKCTRETLAREEDREQESRIILVLLRKTAFEIEQANVLQQLAAMKELLAAAGIGEEVQA